MRQTSRIVYLSVDSLLPSRGKGIAGFDEFTAALDHAGIPSVWMTDRTRLQIDEPRRKMGHAHPFIAEGGCGIYLPEGYFNLKVENAVRLGRFLCIPVAKTQPMASEALESLSEDTGVPVVPLRSLPPRELAQNSGLPQREADLARQRDFDELFFFAGAPDAAIERFRDEVQQRKLSLRQHGALQSLAVGANVASCIRELSRLYDRALRSHLTRIGIAAKSDLADGLLETCDRAFLLLARADELETPSPTAKTKLRTFSLQSPDLWEQLLEVVTAKG